MGYGSAPAAPMQYGYPQNAAYSMPQMQVQSQVGVQQTPFGPLSTMPMVGAAPMQPAPVGGMQPTGMMMPAPPNAHQKEDPFAFLD